MRLAYVALGVNQVYMVGLLAILEIFISVHIKSLHSVVASCYRQFAEGAGPHSRVLKAVRGA